RAVRRFCNALRIVTSTVSLGEVDTIVSHPASTSHASLTRAERLRFGITDGLLRLSIGIEDEDDLIGDLEQALKRA
ncbi:MAG TPA: PLP-dependent transferase, partial [bacterium]